MAAYVGFGAVTIKGTDYEYPSLIDTSVDAKKTEIKVTKTVADGDHVTKTGDVLEYTITTKVPYIEPTDTDKTFWVYDELTGAEYTKKKIFQLHWMVSHLPIMKVALIMLKNQNVVLIFLK